MNIAATEINPDPQTCAVCKKNRAVILHQGEDLTKRPTPLCEHCIRPMTARLRKFLQKFGAVAIH
jgi:hypothetical protein